MQRWHILRTEPGREATAGQWLGRIDIESYRPVYKVAAQQGRQKPRTCSMFSGYLFALVYPQQEAWPIITSLPGILGYLRSDGAPATISQQAIDQIKQYEENYGARRNPKWAFKPGDTVRTTDSAGMWFGHKGLLLRLDKADRATVEIMLLGRCTPVALSARWLELADDAPARVACR